MFLSYFGGIRGKIGQFGEMYVQLGFIYVVHVNADTSAGGQKPVAKLGDLPVLL